MCGSVIQVEVSLLDTFAMIALRVAQSEQPLFQKIVFLVPKRERDILQAMSIAHASYAIFTPSISPRPGMIVGEMAPSITVGGIVLSNSSPLTFCKVRAPLLPILLSLTVLLESLLFLAEIFVIVSDHHVDWRRMGGEDGEGDMRWGISLVQGYHYLNAIEWTKG